LLREATISAPPGTAATEPDSGPRTAATRAGGGRALWLAQLTLANFRSYARMSLEVDPRPVVLTGPNGAGKTNVLEAISFLSPGRGLRGARLGEVVRRHEAAPAAENADDGPSDGGWSVAARVVTPDGPRDVGTGRENGAEAGGDPAAPEARERRLVKIDGAFARGQQTLAEVVRLVWLTPRMDGLFREGAGARRRFLDRLVTGFDPGHAGRLAAYEQALRQRARLLRSGGADDAWLTALEDTMARHGVAVAAARRALIGDLSRACALGVGPFPRAGVALLGDIDDWLDALPALGVEDELRTRLAAGRGQDAESGGAAVGPHRSDLAVHDLETGRPAGQGSTGEQKAMMLSIVLAHARLVALESGAPPLLLLDEVAAHLDEARRAALFEEILALGAQAWLTGTDDALFAGLGEGAQHYRVAEGRIRPAA
jgi:DNA replication and repair protein RecF